MPEREKEGNGLKQLCVIEQFSTECYKTKTKVIILAKEQTNQWVNQNLNQVKSRRESQENLRARLTIAFHFWFYFWLVNNEAREFWKSHYE